MARHVFRNQTPIQLHMHIVLNGLVQPAQRAVNRIQLAAHRRRIRRQGSLKARRLRLRGGLIRRRLLANHGREFFRRLGARGSGIIRLGKADDIGLPPTLRLRPCQQFALARIQAA